MAESTSGGKDRLAAIDRSLVEIRNALGLLAMSKHRSKPRNRA
jgi:hypothetical protein